MDKKIIKLAGNVNDLVRMLHPTPEEGEKGKAFKRECTTLMDLYAEAEATFPGYKINVFQRILNEHFADLSTQVSEGKQGKAQAYFLIFDPTYLEKSETGALEGRVEALEKTVGELGKQVAHLHKK